MANYRDLHWISLWPWLGCSLRMIPDGKACSDKIIIGHESMFVCRWALEKPIDPISILDGRSLCPYHPLSELHAIGIWKSFFHPFFLLQRAHTSVKQNHKYNRILGELYIQLQAASAFDWPVSYWCIRNDVTGAQWRTYWQRCEMLFALVFVIAVLNLNCHKLPDPQKLYSIHRFLLKSWLRHKRKKFYKSHTVLSELAFEFFDTLSLGSKFETQKT